MNPRAERAFTLIELLIVVSIIAILAAIATVHLAESQTRAKVARVHSDIRVVMGALAAYQVDERAYPVAAIGDYQLTRPLDVLTHPTAYLTAVPRDPFGEAPFDFAPALRMEGYNYKDAASTSKNMPAETYGYIWEAERARLYMLHSCGPNRVWDVTPYTAYDPTNGTTSLGDICRFGPL